MGVSPSPVPPRGTQAPAPPRGTDPRRAETRRTLWEVVDAGLFWTWLTAAAYLTVIGLFAAIVIAPFSWLLPRAVGFQLYVWSNWVPGARLVDPQSAMDAFMRSALVGAVSPVLTGVIVALALFQVVSSFVGGKRRRLLRRMGAYVPLGEQYAPTRDALMDMSIAAGLGTPPALYMIDTQSVNAALLAQSAERSAIVVTYGFTHRMSRPDQRAVFAHLLGRLNYRRTPAVLMLSALLDPIDRLNVLDRGWRRAADALAEGPSPSASGCVLVLAGLALCMIAGPLVILFGGPVLLALVLVWILSAVAEQVFHRTYCALADFGDAEGMMLLKDPDEMLGALERVLAEDNGVQYAGTALPMFYCWPMEAPPSVDDPERRRIEHLRHTLGAVAHRAPDAEPRPAGDPV
jgi:hypothetical protein